MSDEIIRVTSLDEGFCSWLEREVTGTRFEVGYPTPERERQPQWVATAGYGQTFRAILHDGRDTAAAVPPALTEAARRISGLDEVVAFRVQANVMLPGTGLSRHTDVPEFQRARRWSFPDWLLVAMLHSGVYDAEQVKVISALVWPCATSGGALRVFDRSNSSLRASFEPEQGTAIVFDTCRLPHDVHGIPGDEVSAGPGDTIEHEAGQWVLRHPDGSVATLRGDQVRVSALVKLGCFAGAADRDAYFGPAGETLDEAEVIASLMDRLPADARRRTGESLQPLVDHFVSYL